MKIRELLFASALLLTASFCSCNENEVVTPSRGEQTQSIAFSISIPKGDPVTYADIHHDAAEWAIKSLWIYEFDGSTSDPNTAKLLKAPEDVIADLRPVSGPKYEYTRKIKSGDDGMRQFIFVANEPVPAGVTAGTTTLGDLKKELASKTLAGSSKSLLNDFSGEQAIPMTGFAKQGSNTLIAVTGATGIEVKMRRIVARIDVQNKVTNLKVTALQLNKTNSRSYLFQNGDYDTPSASVKVGNIGTFTDIGTGINYNGELQKAFYLYEGDQPADEKDAVHVEVRGELNGKKVLYQIPFWKEGKKVPVQRNYAYRIVLGNDKPVISESKVQFTIQWADWNEIPMFEEFQPISANANVATGLGVTYDEATHTLNFTKDEYTGTEITFDFSTLFEAHTKFAVKSDPALPTWFEGKLSGNKVTVTVQENTSGLERKGVIIVTSDADADSKYYINVVQAG